MADMVIVWDDAAIRAAINTAEGTADALEAKAAQIAARANALSSGFRTGIFHDHATGETRGNTRPEYASNVRRFGQVPVGLVYTANYAAQKDTYENNTLLKSIGGS